jgi:hypothetical protein
MIDTITKAAILVRTAIDSIPRDQRIASLRSFPHGACGDSSLLLSRYLTEIGIPGVKYVRGEAVDRQTHAWLEIEDLIVDITYDQFDSARTGVFVAKDRSWHSRFDVIERQNSCWSQFDDRTRQLLDSAYALVRNEIDRLSARTSLDKDKP